MKRFKNILIATDTRLENQSIVDEAADIAKKDGAALKIVDVVPPLPWTTRLLVSDHEHISELMIREKQEQLEELVGPLRDEGIGVTAKVLHGQTSVEIIREVLRARHDLVMRVAKGSDSRRKGFFGTTGTRLLRECPCAVHLVAPNSSTQVAHVLVCIDTAANDDDDTEFNETLYELAKTFCGRHDAKMSIVHAWTIEGEKLLDGRMPKGDFEKMKRARQEYVKGLLDKFLKPHGMSSKDKHVHMLKGHPFHVIPAFAKKEGVDLIVMGTVGRSGAAGLLMGNTAEQILSLIECSVLAVKTKGFVSPIKMGDYVESANA